MADAKTRNTGQNPKTISQTALDLAHAMVEIAELKRRIEALEAEMAVLTSLVSNGAASSRRLAPPPLPAEVRKPAPNAPVKATRRPSVSAKGFVDVSEIAELVDESNPPPRRRS